MKVRELIAALQKLSEEEQEMEVMAWLPGSRIEFSSVIGATHHQVLIEGNLADGSVLLEQTGG